MKYFLVLLFCSVSCFGQTRAQLKQQLAEDDEFIRTLVTVNASLRSQLDKAKADLEEQKTADSELAQFALDQFVENTNLRNTNELLRNANSSLSRSRTVVMPALPMPTPAPQPQTIVIKQEAPYQSPVWDSPVHCSGYEMPVGGGITLTNQNCH